MVRKKSIIYFSRLVDKSFHDGYLCAKAADDTKPQYGEFLEEVEQEHREKFKQLDMKQNRIDEFLGSYLNGNKNTKNFGIYASSSLLCRMGKVMLKVDSVSILIMW